MNTRFNNSGIMRAINFLFIGILFLQSPILAQKKVRLEDNSNAALFFYNNGNASLGTSTTIANFFTIKGTTNNNSYSGLVIQSNWGNTLLDKEAGRIVFQAKDNDTGSAQETFATINAKTTNWTDFSNIGGYLSFSTRINGTLAERMRITKNGNVGIGTLSTGTHKLAVEGSIGARLVKVEATSWPDYVFEKEYILSSLEDLERFILLNKHLPEIPSAKEVVEEGIDLGAMNSKLLQKIEELTLYLIEQNKQLKAQLSRVSKLEKELRGLKMKKN